MAGSGQENDIIFAKNADFSGSATVSGNNGINADNQVWMGRSASVGSLSQIDVMTLTAGPGISFSRTGEGVPGTPGVFEISATGPSTDLHDSRFIVSAGGAADGANYTTIASAITAATSAGGVQTIMIQPGTYTEDLTLPANINLVAHVGDQMTPTVTIVGKITCSDAGSRTISGIRLQTNSDFCLVVSGSVATVIRLTNCRIQATNNTAISFTSSSSSSLIDIEYCSGDITTTGIAIVSSSSAGRMNINYSRFRNTGNSTTNNTFISGDFQTRASEYESAWTFSSSAGCDFNNSLIYTAPLNITCLTVNSTSGSGNNCYFCRFDSGSAIAVSIGASATVSLSQCSIASSATPVSGTGTARFGDITFASTGRTISSALTRTSFPNSNSKLEFLSTQTASNSSSIVFTEISTAYTSYMLIISEAVPVTNTANMRLTFSINGGSSYLLSNYVAGTLYTSVTGAAFTNSNSTANIVLSGPISNAGFFTGNYILTGLNTGGYGFVSGQAIWNDTLLATYAMGTTGGLNNGSTAINTIRLTMSTGNISSGKFTLYGIRENIS